MSEPTFSKLYLHRDTNRLYFHLKVPQGEQIEELDLGGELGTDDVLRWIADYMVDSENRKLSIVHKGHNISPRTSPVPKEAQWRPRFNVRFHGGDKTTDWRRSFPDIICDSEVETIYKALLLGIKFVDRLEEGGPT